LAGRALLICAVLAAVPLSGSPGWASTDPGLDKQWGTRIIGAPEAWASGTGRGIVIATVDSGVDLDHEDLRGQILQGKDYVDGDSDPQDGFGHGTHVAGIASAVAGNGRGVAGVAPGAKILPVRVFDDDGEAQEDFAAPIRWATDHGADVINLSAGTVTQGLGQDEALFGPEFRRSIEYAWSKGVIVVVAAGNDFLLSSGYADHSAIVVSATNRRDGKPDFSSGVGNAKWGMAAPGGSSTTDRIEDDIYSTYTGNGYKYLRGTSMAAPHVAGAAAVLRGLGLSPQRTVERLLSTAKDVGSKGNDSTFGHGRLDLASAVAGLKAGTKQPAGSPASTVAGTSSGPAAGEGGAAENGGAAEDRGAAITAEGSIESGDQERSRPARTLSSTGDDQPFAGETRDKDRSQLPGIIAAAVVLAAVASGWGWYAHVRRRR
jgi:subtilisin family serine protease